MFRLTAPSEDEIQRFISRQKNSRFSYPDVGASAANVPDSYNLDRNRVQLGSGEVIWNRAVQAIRAWKMFDMRWVRLRPSMAPIEVGSDVAVSVRHCGFYSLNACRIIYVVEEDAPIRRFGFAYGTLAEHAESGEERFTVEWNRADGRVWYDILAFSRPHTAWTKIAYPLTRWLQKKFARSSKSSMLRTVSGA